MVMQNVSRAIKVLKAIQHRGIRLAIDDFGTGYWSMSLMKQFPIDTIKIDRCFVRDLADDSEDQTIAQAIIRMGEALGMMSLPKAWKPPARRPSCAIRAAMKCRVFCSANRSRRNNWPICFGPRLRWSPRRFSPSSAPLRNARENAAIRALTADDGGRKPITIGASLISVARYGFIRS
jgi:hypothetical protein